MKLSWVMLLASEIGDGTPSSGSAPTSAAAWSCEENAEKWGYSKNKGTDNLGPEGKSWRESANWAEEAWSVDRPDASGRMFAEAQGRMETSCIA